MAAVAAAPGADWGWMLLPHPSAASAASRSHSVSAHFSEMADGVTVGRHVFVFRLALRKKNAIQECESFREGMNSFALKCNMIVARAVPLWRLRMCIECCVMHNFWVIACQWYGLSA